MTSTRADRDQQSLRRRLQVLRLPVVPLRRVGYLTPSQTDPEWQRTPQAVGVGPDQEVLAVWNHRDQPQRRLVTTHDGSRQPVASVILDGCLQPHFVQPLPDGRILLVRARNGQGANAEIWSSDGQHHHGDLGDAIEDVLTTPTGEIWVSYFDEAMSGSGPQTHGLARFANDLQPAWLYPRESASVSDIFDCYALNVANETAWTCAYTHFHLVSACGDRAIDHGEAPYRSAHRLLVGDRTGALISGPGPEYDLVSGFQINPEGLVATDSPRRLVLPDGMELRDARSTCRGPDLHVFIRTAWYRTDLDLLRVTG
ncbi:hypothetical protein ACQEVC_23645 [Plantactinospora sp. CA-294935]|uniref:hypothetical protein n=1 Tax=Plantactinospora sp. CA-294935 TaxID=3240012 RepID=UPI003D8AEFE9